MARQVDVSREVSARFERHVQEVGISRCFFILKYTFSSSSRVLGLGSICIDLEENL
jgi:hypothetical protein